MHRPTPLFHGWLAAEKAASAAERELHAAMLRFAAGEGPQPTADVVQLASARRAVALDLFPQAMQELKQIADSLRLPQMASSKPSTSPIESSGAATPRQADDANGIRSPSA